MKLGKIYASSNTAYLTTKAYKRIWLIRRLKCLGASSALSEKTDIDRVVKVGLKIIYGNMYQGFENTLLLFGVRKPTLQQENMTEQFDK